jgi:hypothetical protein
MREWYVIRLNRPEDTTKGRITNASDQQQLNVEDLVEMEVPRTLPQRDRNRGVADRIEQARVQLNQSRPAQKKSGYGYYCRPGDRDDKSGQIAHTTEEAAERYAEELAAKTPGVMYGIFVCSKVFETTTPSVITKKFNDSGELVLDEREKIE